VHLARRGREARQHLREAPRAQVLTSFTSTSLTVENAAFNDLTIWRTDLGPPPRHSAIAVIVPFLDRGGGRTPVTTVRRRIEATFGRPLARYGLPTLAARCGAVVRGKWVEREVERS
jgi:hypothetical protein